MGRNNVTVVSTKGVWIICSSACNADKGKATQSGLLQQEELIFGILDARCGLGLRRCGYPADSSYLATGAAGTATSTPSPHRGRPDRSSRLTPCPVPAGDSDIPGVACRSASTLLHNRPRAAAAATSAPSSYCRRADRSGIARHTWAS